MMQKKNYFFIILLFLLFFSGFYLNSDIIILKNGGRLYGIIERKKKGIEITLPYGKLFIPYKKIKKIIISETPLDKYRSKKLLLDPEDVEGHYKLALWCQQNGLLNQFKKELKYVLTLDPDHEKARRLLGYEKYKGRWITHDEAMEIRGFIKYKGKWVSRSKYNTLLIKELEKKLENETLKRVELEKKLKEAYEEIDELREKLAELKGYVEKLSQEVRRTIIIYRYKDNDDKK